MAARKLVKSWRFPRGCRHARRLTRLGFVPQVGGFLRGRSVSGAMHVRRECVFFQRETRVLCVRACVNVNARMHDRARPRLHTHRHAKAFPSHPPPPASRSILTPACSSSPAGGALFQRNTMLFPRHSFHVGVVSRAGIRCSIVIPSSSCARVWQACKRSLTTTHACAHACTRARMRRDCMLAHDFPALPSHIPADYAFKFKHKVPSSQGPLYVWAASRPRTACENGATISAYRSSLPTPASTPTASPSVGWILVHFNVSEDCSSWNHSFLHYDPSTPAPADLAPPANMTCLPIAARETAARSMVEGAEGEGLLNDEARIRRLRQAVKLPVYVCVGGLCVCRSM